MLPSHTPRSTPVVSAGAGRSVGPVSDAVGEGSVARPRDVLPAGTPRQAPRWVEAERDYRAPVPVERARLLREAYQAATADAEQRLLLAELMAHYRRWCLGQRLDDPFAPDARPGTGDAPGRAD